MTLDELAEHHAERAAVLQELVDTGRSKVNQAAWAREAAVHRASASACRESMASREDDGKLATDTALAAIPAPQSDTAPSPKAPPAAG